MFVRQIKVLPWYHKLLDSGVGVLRPQLVCVARDGHRQASLRRLRCDRHARRVLLLDDVAHPDRVHPTFNTSRSACGQQNMCQDG